MKQYSHKEFASLLRKNDYSLNRTKGSHFIYTNKEGNHTSIPHKLSCVIARRLIKENKLKI